MTKYVISDLRRYSGTTEAVVHSVNNHVAAEVSGALIFWIARPNQKPTLPTDRVVHVGEPDDTTATECTIKWIEQIAANGYCRDFLVYSFDADFRIAVLRSAGDGVTITTQHLGSLLQAKTPVTWVPVNPYGLRPGTVIGTRPAPFASAVSEQEVDQAIASMLHELGYVSPHKPLLESQVREQLVMREPRMAKVPGDPASESLIQRWRQRNLTRGHIGRIQAADRTNTWGVYLTDAGKRRFGLMGHLTPKEIHPPIPAAPLPPPAPATPTTPLPLELTQQAPVKTPGVTPLDRQLVELTRLEKIGVMPESAEWIWRAVEQLICQPDKQWTVPILLREAVRIAEPEAIRNGYTNEKRWDVAKRCLERLMLVAGAFIDSKDVPIPCGPGSKSAIVKSLALDFRMRCWAYTVEFVIEKRHKVDYDEIICALGLLLFRSSQRHELDVLENRADEVIEYLKQGGRLVEDRMGTQTILQRPRMPALLKMQQAAGA